MVRKLGKSNKCEYPDCDNKATHIVYSRNLDKVLLCCESHESVVISEGCPEYHDQCMNCGCTQGVN